MTTSEPAPAYQLARIRATRACDMHRGVQWSGASGEIIGDTLHGRDQQGCAELCLETDGCTAFQIYIGNDREKGQCTLYRGSAERSLRDQMIQSQRTRDRVIGFCEKDYDTEGSVMYPTTRYEHQDSCTLLRPMKWKIPPSKMIGEALPDQDAQSCTDACLRDPKCTAFDVYIRDDRRSGQCRLYEVDIPWDTMPTRGILEADPKRDHVVGVCRRVTTNKIMQ